MIIPSQSVSVPHLASLPPEELALFCREHRHCDHPVLRNAAYMGECIVKSRILGQAGITAGQHYFEDQADLVYQTSLAGIVEW